MIVTFASLIDEPNRWKTICFGLTVCVRQGLVIVLDTISDALSYDYWAM